MSLLMISSSGGDTLGCTGIIIQVGVCKRVESRRKLGLLMSIAQRL
jgi:hypothetical protein